MKNEYCYLQDETNEIYPYDWFMENVMKKKAKKKEEAKLDLSHLDKLVLEPEKKNDIIAVLKQSEKKGKIFDEWGLSETIEYGRGMTMLFWGPPGTGKTWAASCISKALGKELHSVNVSQIRSAMAGETEKNLQNAFDEATQKHSVLFLDEADSFLMSRNNVGMIIGGEINVLLQALEKFEGVCIMATNRVNELDEALERRISLILEFKEPNREERRAIWERLIPKKMPLAKDVSFDDLADIAITGGIIKNAILNAARLAVADEKVKEVAMEHFVRAIERAKEGSKAFKLPSKTPSTRGRVDYVRMSG